MADSSTKTEQPTAKKLKDGIKQGQVARSADVAAWTGLLALTFVLPFMVEQLTVQLEALLKTIPEIARQPSPQLLGDIALPAVVTMSLLLVPFFLVILVVTQLPQASGPKYPLRTLLWTDVSALGRNPGKVRAGTTLNPA